ncbi:MAG: peptide chain release factor 1 [Vulcanimicrobiota bacterium]
MLESLQRIEEKFAKINKQLCEPEIISDSNKLQQLSKERSDLEDIVNLAKKFHKAQDELEDAKTMIEIEEDPDMVSYMEDEKERLENELDKLEQEIKILMLPKDPYGDKNILMEIRQGTGGDEAALFAANLTRMYLRYAEQKGFKSEIVNMHETELGGVKEAVLGIKGKGAYARFKFESGVHRVQRVPDTEASGRIHTSTATVAVLPEAEDVDIQINPDELRIDTYCASSAGGQHVNRTESAIRITHEPTGIVVTCQDERSQRQNREKAMRLLRTKLLEMAIQEQEKEIASTRKLQVGTGARSEKIRTYNFPQSRITDHRIGFTMHNLEGVLEGNLDPLLDALQDVEKEELLQEVGKE